VSALSIGVPYRTPPPCKTKRLPNGAPAVRLRFLAQRLHDLGPRPLHGFHEEILKGADLVTTLERHAAIDPRIVDALGRARTAARGARRHMGPLMTKTEESGDLLRVQTEQGASKHARRQACVRRRRNGESPWSLPSVALPNDGRWAPGVHPLGVAARHYAGSDCPRANRGRPPNRLTQNARRGWPGAPGSARESA
jgi:hypothetical protein